MTVVALPEADGASTASATTIAVSNAGHIARPLMFPTPISF
jgi:hypothetical protein